MFPNPEKMLSIWLASLKPEKQAEMTAKVDFIHGLASTVDQRLANIEEMQAAILEEVLNLKFQESTEQEQLDTIQETTEHTDVVVKNISGTTLLSVRDDGNIGIGTGIGEEMDNGN